MIWVVTNHQDTRRSLAPLIAAKGYQVTEFDCGEEVLKRVRFQTPTLIIIDCGVSGSFDMLKAIRGEARSRAIPVVMFSIDDQILKDQALLSGADAYVPKGSLDWAELLIEVVRFAGPPTGSSTV
ncbi:MAG TPA: response regulator [Phycisphaerae bacterium]|nr:response regulator [Phycisphaerae bacterium]